jgi:hypothetical protein
VVGRNVGTFLRRARSGSDCSARASAGDRTVAAQGGLALLVPSHFPSRDTLIWSDLSTAAELRSRGALTRRASSGMTPFR